MVDDVFTFIDVVSIVVPLTCVASDISIGFTAFLPVEVVVGTVFVVIIVFCVEVVGAGFAVVLSIELVGFGRNEHVVPGSAFMLFGVITSAVVPLTVVIPFTVVICNVDKVGFPLVTVLLLVVGINSFLIDVFCVGVCGNDSTVFIGSERKVEFSFLTSFPGGAAMQVCSNNHSNEIPNKQTLNIMKEFFSHRENFHRQRSIPKRFAIDRKKEWIDRFCVSLIAFKVKFCFHTLIILLFY